MSDATASSDESPPFSAICNLLDDLEMLLQRYKAPNTKLTKKTFRERQNKTISQWIMYFNPGILSNSSATLAVLSLLFPKLRRERVVFLQEHTLSAALAHVMGMGKDGTQRLRNWKSKYEDYGTAVEKEVALRVVSLKN